MLGGANAGFAARNTLLEWRRVEARVLVAQGKSLAGSVGRNV
jgi:hypothetical protein